MLTLNAPWLLAASFLLHLIATVVWIGGLVTMALVVWPGLRRAVSDEAALGRTVEAIDARFRPLANLSLVVLVLTGLVQMNANVNYKGFLNFDNLWAQAILLKHVSIVGMIAVGATMQFVIQPALQRHALLARAGVANEAEAVALRRRMQRLSSLNLVLGIVVLVFTAIARAQ
jgi:uncharacterized membrane protein